MAAAHVRFWTRRIILLLDLIAGLVATEWEGNHEGCPCERRAGMGRSGVFVFLFEFAHEPEEVV